MNRSAVASLGETTEQSATVANTELSSAENEGPLAYTVRAPKTPFSSFIAHHLSIKNRTGLLTTLFELYLENANSPTSAAGEKGRVAHQSKSPHLRRTLSLPHRSVHRLLQRPPLLLPYRLPYGYNPRTRTHSCLYRHLPFEHRSQRYTWGYFRLPMLRPRRSLPLSTRPYLLVLLNFYPRNTGRQNPLRNSPAYRQRKLYGTLISR
jgi:hypothetical protein